MGGALQKYRPDGWLHPLITLTGERLLLRKVDVGVDRTGTARSIRSTSVSAIMAAIMPAWRYNPFRRWAGGVRYDWSQYPINPGWEWAIEPYVSFWPSEFPPDSAWPTSTPTAVRKLATPST